MKRVAILSLYYKNYNYGGQLQSYALQKTIQNLGYQCEQISFNRERKDVFWRKIRQIMRSTVVEKKKYILRVYNSFMRRFKKIPMDNATFDRFDQWMYDIPHTSIVNRDTISSIKDDYDFFVVGSDQVWNPEFVPMTFFLDFIDNNNKKIAYAASTRIKKFEKKESKIIKNLLSEFNYISVRENDAKKLLRDIGVSKDIDVNLDPTLLLSKEEWTKKIIKPEIKQQFIFTYLISDPFALNQIREFAIQNQCKIISVNTPGYITDEDDVFIRLKSGVGPAEFLGLIANARYVFIESFHGIVFSLIFEKDFFVYGELSDDRKITLLNLVGLSDKLINHSASYNEFVFKEINYNIVKQKIEDEKNKSIQRLRHYLGE